MDVRRPFEEIDASASFKGDGASENNSQEDEYDGHRKTPILHM